MVNTPIPDGFKQARIELCVRLADAAWGKWAKVEGFPSNPAHRLAFVNDYLAKALAEEDVTPLHLRSRLKYPIVRKDLNAYRGWLLTMVVNQLQRDAAAEGRAAEQAFIFPEDLIKAVEDLNLFRRYCERDRQKPGTGIPAAKRSLSAGAYPNTAALRDAIKDEWRPKYPLTNPERATAHRTYLKEHSGSGDAELVETLEDGTEIIWPKTWDASKAYGSPRWCTVYGQEYFNQHSAEGRLLIAVAPEGTRWQIHPESKQYKDATDKPVKAEELPQAVRRWMVGRFYARIHKLAKTGKKRAWKSFIRQSDLAMADPAAAQKFIKDMGRRVVNSYLADTTLTAISSAAAYGDSACVKLLLDAGADPDKADKNGRTPLQMSHPTCKDLLREAMRKRKKSAPDQPNRCGSRRSVSVPRQG